MSKATTYPITNPAGFAAGIPNGLRRHMHYTGDAMFDSGMAFLQAELEKADPKIREPLTSVTWTRDIVAKTGGGWVDFTSMMNVGYASVGGNSNGIIGGQTNAIPVIQADLAKEMFRVFTFGHILRVPFIDQSKLEKIGRSLPELLDKGIHLNHQKALDQNVYTGYGDLGSQGILNNDAITATAAPATGAAGATTFASKTPDQVLDDFNTALNTVWAAVEYDLSGMPNQVLIPPNQYGQLVSRKVSEAGNISLLKYLLENNIANNQGRNIEIFPSRWCVGAGTGGTDRAFFYVNSEDFLYFDITVPLTRILTQASVTEMAYLTAYAAQHGEVKFAYPQAALYVDGI